jgi:dihydropteroate synthase
MAQKKIILKYNGKSVDLSDKIIIMGILNVTPDSFFDGGRYSGVDRAVDRGQEMINEGADIIDIGGESSRPGAEPVSEVEEKKRVIPVIKKLAKKANILISVDTRKAEVAREAVDTGAGMINDISALSADRNMAGVVKRSKVPVCIMHMQGNPQNMQVKPHYKDVVKEIKVFLKDRIDFCRNQGIDENRIIVDPGIGFGKTVEHNLEILRRLTELGSIGRPVMIGLSRKSFMGKLLGLSPGQRMETSLALHVWCMLNGANILRVHDVMETSRAVKIIKAVTKGKYG